MVISAIRGGIGFLTRVPIGHDKKAWDAFRQTPVAFTVIGYPLGTIVALPFVFLSIVPVPTLIGVYLLILIGVTGITHIDGIADIGDAAVVHDTDDEHSRRRSVLHDSQVGVGGALAVTVTVVSLALGVLGATRTTPQVTFTLVLTAEVGAKSAMALLVCTGDAAHDGLGAALIDESTPLSLFPVILALTPLLLAIPYLGASPTAAVVLTPLIVALVIKQWADDALGGISGDVLGAVNEVSRAAAIHAGVVVWML